MRYRGTLYVPDQPADQGLPVVLVLGDRNLELLAGDQSLGTYPIWNVKAERVGTDRFELNVAGDHLIFEADDAIAFSYEGLPRISKSSVPMVSDLVKRWFSGRTESQLSSQITGSEEEEPTAATVTQLIPPPLEEPEPHRETEIEPLTPAAEMAVGEPAIAVRSIREALTEAPDACPGLKADGELCGSTDLGSRGFCDVHDPDRIAERRVSRERLETVLADASVGASTAGFVDVVARLEKAFVEVHEGNLDVDRASAMAELVQAMCAAHDRAGASGLGELA